MKNQISDLLDKVLVFLLKWQFPVCNYLNGPIKKNVINDMFLKMGLRPTTELLELYQWRNGTKIVEGTVLDDIQLIPGFHLLSLEDATSNYLAMKEDKYWNPNWFPIFANGGGDFYAMELTQSNGENAPIIGFLLGEVEQDVEYKSLTTMLLTFTKCYEKNIIYRTEDGYLEMNDEELAEIALKYNPDLKFWNS